MTIEKIATFYLNENIYGIPVQWIQEVTGIVTPSSTPLAPSFVSGLINLRGQIAMVVDLKTLLKQRSTEVLEPMSVVCKIDNNLVSIVVDTIEEVVDVAHLPHEPPPDTVDVGTKKFIQCIYKTDGKLISCFNVEKLCHEIFNNLEGNF